MESYGEFERKTRLAAERIQGSLGESSKLFFQIEELYNRGLSSVRQSETQDEVVFSLCWLCNCLVNTLYNAYEAYLHLQSWNRLVIQRYGIECVLKTSHLNKYPESLPQFLNNDLPYQNIKRTVREDIAFGSGRYPILEALISAHELCSSYGAHADIASLTARRFKVEYSEELRQHLSYFQHLQIPESEEDLHRDFHMLMMQYYLSLLVYRAFFRDHSSLSIGEWDERTAEIKTGLDALHASLPSARTG
ncbi:hypothetical protein IT157_07715 [bacterium]|nr:hypothetical protein [bacterium]